MSTTQIYYRGDRRRVADHQHLQLLGIDVVAVGALRGLFAGGHRHHAMVQRQICFGILPVHRIRAASETINPSIIFACQADRLMAFVDARQGIHGGPVAVVAGQHLGILSILAVREPAD